MKLFKISYVFAFAAFLLASGLSAAEDLDGPAIALKVDQRPEAEKVREIMEMRLVNRRGATRSRRTVVLEHDEGDVRKVAIFFLEPVRVKGMAFLYYDFNDTAQEDNRWLYMPRMRRTRRISASDRGDYFLGTDFTYQDIQDQTKFSLADYTFVLEGEEEVEGVMTYRIQGTPKTPEIAQELGYRYMKAWINPENWMPVKADYWDTSGNFLKTIVLSDHVQVDGFWTALKITATNHKTGHRTELTYSDVSYTPEISARSLTPDGLRDGPGIQ